jgi:hypothetical protein
MGYNDFLDRLQTRHKSLLEEFPNSPKNIEEIWKIFKTVQRLKNDAVCTEVAGEKSESEVL